MHEGELQLRLDRDAREAAFALEMTGKLPPRFAEQHHPLTRCEQHELRRLKAALAAAVDADTFVALARGYPVPISRIRPPVRDYQKAREAAHV